MPNFFTINGRAFPSTDTIRMQVDETLKVRFVGSSSGFIHPMHIHGGPFQVVARDGETLAPAQRFMADTLNVGPGQRYDVIWKAQKPGMWMIHCHISHHTHRDRRWGRADDAYPRGRRSADIAAHILGLLHNMHYAQWKGCRSGIPTARNGNGFRCRRCASARPASSAGSRSRAARIC